MDWTRWRAGAQRPQSSMSNSPTTACKFHPARAIQLTGGPRLSARRHSRAAQGKPKWPKSGKVSPRANSFFSFFLYFLVLFSFLFLDFKFNCELVLILNVQMEHTSMGGFMYLYIYFSILYSISFSFPNSRILIRSLNPN
jgi:hypothetical protein